MPGQDWVVISAIFYSSIKTWLIFIINYSQAKNSSGKIYGILDSDIPNSS